VIDPCSITVIDYQPTRPFVVRVNDSGADLATLLSQPTKARKGGRRAASGSDAPVGGGAGPS